MERGMSVDQVVRALWRRKLLVLAISGGVFAVGAAIVATLPSEYKATTVIRVEPHHPVAEMVAPTISEAVEQRIVTIRQELLARPVLQKAIEDLHLYPDIVEDDGIDAAVERMRKDLDVKVQGENAFEVTYTGEDPVLVARVANTLPKVFAEQGGKMRMDQATRTVKLFEDEIDPLKKEVTDWETKIAQFKVDHLGELPDQLESNMRSLDRMGAQLNQRNEELRLTEIRLADMLKANHAADSEAGRASVAVDDLKQALLNARTTWTDDHPEVQKIDQELTGMEKQLRDAEARLTAERQEKARLTQQIDGLHIQIADLRKQSEAYQLRLDNTPKWTNELAMMNRDFEVARGKLDSVISRKVEAELSRELEARAQKELFHVISTATIPQSAAKPDRLGGLTIALLVALGLGVLAGILVDMRDESIRDVNEVRERLPVPVLAVVPELGAGKLEKRVLMPANTHRGGGAADPLN